MNDLLDVASGVLALVMVFGIRALAVLLWRGAWPDDSPD